MKNKLPKQNLQNWITQKWVILFGKKIIVEDFEWLISPFGENNVIGLDYISYLAEKENLLIDKSSNSKGLLNSFSDLGLSENEIQNIPNSIVNFYENTSEFNLQLTVKWNPFFKIMGILVNLLFSSKINQLNIPTNSNFKIEQLNSEIIQLINPKTNEIKYTFWVRKQNFSQQVIYLGIYGTCTLPNSEKFVKVVFPLPKGNATIILRAQVGKNGEFVLDSSGEKIGDPGFYFLLKDNYGKTWTKYIKTFRDKLIMKVENDAIIAEQTLSLWRINVLKFNYKITFKKQK